jgi:WD40 repeat protein
MTVGWVFIIGFFGFIRVASSGHPANWPAEVHIIAGHQKWISSVAYSPDGTHIVSGSWDKTVRVWNATSGQFISGPFDGHTQSVTSVAYSPDGKHIVSGSSDKTIRVLLQLAQIGSDVDLEDEG